MFAQPGNELPECLIIRTKPLGFPGFQGKDSRHMFGDADSLHMAVVLVYADVHIGFAEDVGHFLVTVQNALFHMVNIAAQLRKLHAALDIYSLIQISKGDAVQFFIDAVDAADHIQVHITDDHGGQNHGNGDEAYGKHSRGGGDAVVQILAGDNPADQVFAGLREYTEGTFSVYGCEESLFAGGSLFEAESDFRKVFSDAGQIGGADDFPGLHVGSVITGIGIDAEQ